MKNVQANSTMRESIAGADKPRPQGTIQPATEHDTQRYTVIFEMGQMAGQFDG
jgi:hypothetical protein